MSKSPASSYLDALEIPGTLYFQRDGLEKAVIKTGSCDGEIYLQGAHITHWQPRGEKPVLFLSEKSAFQPGKAIRGGIPIIFPWFGPRTTNKYSQRTDGPSHGFARTTPWQMTGATASGEDVILELQLLPDENTAALGYENFSLQYEVTFGKTLTLKLTCTNEGTTARPVSKDAAPMVIEEALHTYFAVYELDDVAISGLAHTEYLDKTDGMKRKRQEEKHLKIEGETDRPYVNTHATVSILDHDYHRMIKIEKEHSLTTVVWNPGKELSDKMSDMQPDGWNRFVCVESANAGENAILLNPGESHTLTVKISVEKLKQ